MSTPHEAAISRALLSLDGLSVGDALGQLMSTCSRSARRIIEQGSLPGPYWWHTDDTQMAMAIVEELAEGLKINGDSLAKRFLIRYLADPGRGYGKGVRLQMEQIADGASWEKASTQAFGGRGSKGNGSAMRAGPLGAFFAGDPEKLIAESTRSAIVTHCHPEGIAGSVAVSLAAAEAWISRHLSVTEARICIWKAVLAGTPQGGTFDGIQKASLVPASMDPEITARLLGSGFLVTAPDTVPFALWCAIRHLDNFQEAMIATLEGDGDCDTNCAIVGSIVALFTGRDAIPPLWLKSREPLDLDISNRRAEP